MTRAVFIGLFEYVMCNDYFLSLRFLYIEATVIDSYVLRKDGHCCVVVIVSNNFIMRVNDRDIVSHTLTAKLILLKKQDIMEQRISSLLALGTVFHETYLPLEILSS